MTVLISPEILTMPLAELRERVDLAERLAIASRHTNAAGSGPATSAASASGTGKEAPAAGTVKPAAKPATSAAAKPAAAAAKPAAKPAPAVVDDDDAAFGDGGAGDFGDGGDMLDGFVEELSPEQAKAAAVEIAKKVIAAKEKEELTAARGIMAKYGVSKVSDIPDDSAVEAYEAFAEAFPQYV